MYFRGSVFGANGNWDGTEFFFGDGGGVGYEKEGRREMVLLNSSELEKTIALISKFISLFGRF